MKFNFKRYEGVIFHKDPDINKKIKALLLWYDYEVITKDLSYRDRVTLLDKWIKNFIDIELYEAIDVFKTRRDKLSSLVGEIRRSKRPLLLVIKLYFRYYRIKINKIIQK